MKLISLHQLLNSVDIFPPEIFSNPKITNISFNSNEVQAGCLFLGLPGTKVDGGVYWKEAINNGAVAAIISKEAEIISGGVDKEKVLVLKKPLDYVFGQIISEFWNRPSKKLKIIGVTGTNGKTTVTFLLEYLLIKLGKKVALFGTLYNRWQEYSEESSFTTDFADKLQAKLNNAIQANNEFAIMEVSSHAIAQKRISGCEFFCTIFTNLSQDHLDYHHDMESYFETKMELFKPPFLVSKNCFSIINADDNWGRILNKKIESKALMISTENEKEYKYENYYYITQKKFTSKGTVCSLNTPNEKIELFIPLVGEFNLMNSLQAILTVYELGFPLKDICRIIKTFPGVPGRMEKIQLSKCEKKYLLPEVIVDYAHTPDGLMKILETIRNFAEGRIITVFGCGGDRDHTKRSLMGSIAEQFSDYIFITSDNPRSEDPKRIIDDILCGTKNKNKISIEIDRFSAIKKAIDFSISKDIILIAGKGHEDYQILGDKRISFDDKEISSKLLIQKLKSL